MDIKSNTEEFVTWILTTIGKVVILLLIVCTFGSCISTYKELQLLKKNCIEKGFGGYNKSNGEFQLNDIVVLKEDSGKYYIYSPEKEQTNVVINSVYFWKTNENNSSEFE